MKLPWWKWPFWIMACGWGTLLWAVWRFSSDIRTMDPLDAKRRLYPWLAAGVAAYLAGRALQIAARSRSRRLAAEEKEKVG